MVVVIFWVGERRPESIELIDTVPSTVLLTKCMVISVRTLNTFFSQNGEMEVAAAAANSTSSTSASTPKGKSPMALINPRALSNFLKLAHGDGIDAAGLVDGKAARILGWEDVDAARGQSEACWLITSSAAEGISLLKGNRVGSMSVLQGRFTLILVSFGASCPASIMTVKLDEMKKALEVHFLNAVTGKVNQGAAQGDADVDTK